MRVDNCILLIQIMFSYTPAECWRIIKSNSSIGPNPTRSSLPINPNTVGLKNLHPILDKKTSNRKRDEVSVSTTPADVSSMTTMGDTIRVTPADVSSTTTMGDTISFTPADVSSMTTMGDTISFTPADASSMTTMEDTISVTPAETSSKMNTRNNTISMTPADNSSKMTTANKIPIPTGKSIITQTTDVKSDKNTADRLSWYPSEFKDGYPNYPNVYIDTKGFPTKKKDEDSKTRSARDNNYNEDILGDWAWIKNCFIIALPSIIATLFAIIIFFALKCIIMSIYTKLTT